MEAITATYVQDDEHWTITVSGMGQTLTAHAPGIIAARERADQLAEELAPDQPERTVVHLLNGSALEFTAAYLEARLRQPSADEPDAGAANDDPSRSPQKSASSRSGKGARSQRERGSTAPHSKTDKPRQAKSSTAPSSIKPQSAKPPAKPKRAKPAAKRPPKQAPPEDSSPEHPDGSGQAEGTSERTPTSSSA